MIYCLVKMVELRKVIETCVSLASSLCGLRVDGFLSRLTADDIEKNFDVFTKFARACSTQVLAMLFRLDHFAGILSTVVDSR